MKKYLAEYTDEQLVALAQKDDVLAIDEIVFRYLSTVRFLASKFRLPGMEAEDIVQEGFLGLMKAIKLYTPGKSSFKTFSSLCIRSSISTTVRSALSQKNIPLANFTSLEADFLELEDQDTLSPEQIVLAEEQVHEIFVKMSESLTSLEQQTLKLYLAGHSYFEISNILSISSKAVDNALQRVRRKLQSVL